MINLEECIIPVVTDLVDLAVSRFKTTMLKSGLCDYNDAQILVQGTMTITGAGDDDTVKQAHQ